jgi:hypothetical protein
MIRISVTQAAYRAIQASLSPNSTTDFHPEAATVRIWLDPKTVDALSRLRWPGGDLSDVILRLAQLEERPLAKSERPRRASHRARPAQNLKIKGLDVRVGLPKSRAMKIGGA